MKFQELANAEVNAAMSEHNVIDQVKSWPIHDRKAIRQQNSLLYDVAILNVTGELNVGNIIRTAELCGADRVHILGRRKYDKRGTVGAENYIDVRRIDLMDGDQLDLVAVRDYFDAKQLYPVFVEQHDYAQQFDSLEYVDIACRLLCKQPCFVFGNEGRGIPSSLIESFSPNERMVIQLTQRGIMRSFNVGSAAAIVLYRAMDHYWR